MQKISFYLWICFVLLSIANFGCNSKNESSTSATDSATSTTSQKQIDNNVLKNWNVHNENFVIPTPLPAEDISLPSGTINLRKLANACVDQYVDYARHHTFPTGVTQTETITFDKAKLQKWIDSTGSADSIVFKFGVYTNPFIAAMHALHNSPINDRFGDKYPDMDARRKDVTTIFLYAYKGGTEYKPNTMSVYNLGNLHP